jgi:hypothetical protein
MDGVLDPDVAIRATQTAMHGALEEIGLDVEGNDLPIDRLGQIRILVTIQTIGGGKRSGPRRDRNSEQNSQPQRIFHGTTFSTNAREDAALERRAANRESGGFSAWGE